MAKPSQFDLFATRRFLPLFVTQFFGAFNDNLFKNALIVLVTFQGLGLAGLSPGRIVNAAAGLFILPFFLFSALAGQLAEKVDKARIARWVKGFEVALMALAGVGFLQRSAPILFACLFLLGVHSAFFGPLKYSVLPQYLEPDELLGGNGLIEAGTFAAILLGQIAGALLVARGPWYAAVACLGVAVAGLLASRYMPSAPPPAPELRIRWNVFAETGRLIGYAAKNRPVFFGLMGISWFWLFGSVYIVQLPQVAHGVLGGDEAVFTYLLILFSIGLAVGSTLCDKLSGRRVELGLVTVGALGMTLAGVELYFGLGAAATTSQGLLVFLQRPANWRVTIDLVVLGISGGLFSVPLYAFIQLKSDRAHVSRTIAANNILNAAAMVFAALAGIALLTLGLSVRGILLGAALANLLVLGALWLIIPDYTLRFVTWVLAKAFYRVRYEGAEHIPAEGPFIVVCNHVSFIDWLFVAGMIHRPVRFVMDVKFMRIKGIGWLFRAAGIVPIATSAENPELKARAFSRIAAYLEAGEAVCVFPEGRLTSDGTLQPFRPGIETIVRRSPVPVLPAALGGLWGSWFSRHRGAAMRGLPRRIRPTVTLTLGEPMAPQEVSRESLEERVRRLASGFGQS